MAHLRPMGLENVRFRVDFSAAEPMDLGADAICFLFSANPGQPLSPLGEVASGGEMSRFLLALKTCLADVDGSSTLLFDEIDSGVSGRVSGEMANLLRTMAEHRQVFCVTHQPLVAAAADHHFRVRPSHRSPSAQPVETFRVGGLRQPQKDALVGGVEFVLHERPGSGLQDDRRLQLRVGHSERPGNDHRRI